MAPTFTQGCCTEGETRREEAQRPWPTARERPVAGAVRGAQAGDHDALAFLYARYADNVHGYVRGIVHDHHEAEDVTQQVFAKLMQAIGRYEPREAPFLAWLMRLARNAALDHLRRQRLVPVEEVRIADRAHRSSTVSASRVTSV